MELINLTSADASLFLASASTFPVGFAVDGLADGDAISVSGVNAAEMVKGVDDSAGYWYVNNVKEVQLNLMPGQAAKNLGLLAGAMELKKKPDLIQLVVSIPAMGITATFIDGVMTSYPPIPALQQRLGNMSFSFKFRTCLVAPI